MKKKSLPLSQVYQLLEPGPVIMVSTRYKKKENIMTMSWHMMVDFEPPLLACVMSDDNYSFQALMKTKECVINIPTADLAQQVVGVGNTSGEQIDKFTQFHFSQTPARVVNVPMIKECYANIECRVVDIKMALKYNIFILQAVKAWIAVAHKRYRTLHHCGNGVFVIDGALIKLSSNKK